MTSTLLRPAYAVTVAGKRVDTTSEPRASTLVSLTVALDLDTPADAATLELGRIGRLEPVLDDDATIELGYIDDPSLTTVLTGTVGLVDPGLVTSTVVVYSGAATVLRSVANETFENKSAGDIVRDLASRAGVGVGNVEAGSQFPAYVVDGRRGAFEHVLDLAGLCGLDAYVDSGGDLVMERFTGGHAMHVLEHAKHILELDVRRTPPAAAAVEAWGESPGTSRGTNAWAWLTKDFDKLHGSAGSGTPLLVLERPALRSADAAGRAAEGALEAAQSRAVRGRVLTIGRPEVKLGDAIQLRGVPDAAANGSFQVRSVTHRVRKRRGFTTEIGFRATGAPPAATVAAIV
jgi:phage protein D